MFLQSYGLSCEETYNAVLIQPDNGQNQIDGEPDSFFVTKVIDHDEKTGMLFTISDNIQHFEDPMPFYFWLRSQNNDEALQRAESYLKNLLVSKIGPDAALMLRRIAHVGFTQAMATCTDGTHQ